MLIDLSIATMKLKQLKDLTNSNVVITQNQVQAVINDLEKIKSQLEE